MRVIRRVVNSSSQLQPEPADAVRLSSPVFFKSHKALCASKTPLQLILFSLPLFLPLLLAPVTYAAQSLDTAVRNAVQDGCPGLTPVAASNLETFCNDGGAAGSNTGGTITSQTSIGALDKEVKAGPGQTGDQAEDELARVQLGPFSVFITLDFERHEKDATEFEGRGFESDRSAVLAGVDYQLSDNYNLGMALSYAKVDGDFDGEIDGQASGGFDNSSYGLLVFGDYTFAANAFASWSLGYSDHEFETQRYSRVTMGNNVANGVLESDTEADEVIAAVEIGYDKMMGVVSVGPRFAIRYKKTDIDGYAETVRSNNPTSAIAPLALLVRGQTEKSLTSHLGVQLSRAVNWDYGVLLPQLYLDYVHEFQDDQRAISFSFLEDQGNTVFRYHNDVTDRDYGHVLVGLVAVFADGLQSFISYESLLGYSAHDNDKISVGVRLEF